MDAKERAEKIKHMLRSANYSGDDIIKTVAAQIREAEKEAINNCVSPHIIVSKEYLENEYKMGRVSMREEAAKVADEVWEEHKNDGPSAEHMAETIIDQIRKIGVEGK